MAKNTQMNWMQIDRMMYGFFNTSTSVEEFIEKCMKAFSWEKRQAIMNSKLIIETMAKKGESLSGEVSIKKKTVKRRVEK